MTHQTREELLDEIRDDITHNLREMVAARQALHEMNRLPIRELSRRGVLTARTVLERDIATRQACLERLKEIRAKLEAMAPGSMIEMFDGGEP